MDQHQRDEWGALVRSAFCRKKDIIVNQDSDDFVAQVEWTIPETDRLNKRSKTIRLIISQVAISGYYTKEEAGRREQDRQKVEAWIRNKLESFDPNHDTPRGQPSPQVQWTIGTNVLNS